MTRFFQIGFNKCATSSLYRLFDKSGVQSLHSGGRHWRQQKHPAVFKRCPQSDIAANIDEGRPALTGFDDFRAFFDMEYSQGDARVENFRQFKTFARDYPDAKFLLNTRRKKDWLRSRARHGDGKYLKKAMQHLNCDANAVLRAWSDDFDRHTQAVLTFFRAEDDRLLVFDIDNSPIESLIEFAGPDFKLKAKKWGHVRKTDHIAALKNWQDDPMSVAA